MWLINIFFSPCLSPGEWWKYAVSHHLDEIQKRNQRLTWTFIMQRSRDIVLYARAYRQFLSGSELLGMQMKVWGIQQNEPFVACSYRMHEHFFFIKYWFFNISVFRSNQPLAISGAPSTGWATFVLNLVEFSWNIRDKSAQFWVSINSEINNSWCSLQSDWEIDVSAPIWRTISSRVWWNPIKKLFFRFKNINSTVFLH